MNTHDDQREFERIPIDNRVQVRTAGRVAAYALAIDISMGGLLLAAAPPLPVGSPCELAITVEHGSGGEAVVAQAVVVRAGEQGTAFRFLNALDRSAFATVVAQRPAGVVRSFVNAYINYFKVSQDEQHTGCERWFGVTRNTFRNVVLTTFCGCIGVAVLPVWLYHHLFPPEPNWLKIMLSFCYGLLWLAVIQPIVDLAIFRIMKSRSARIRQPLGSGPK